MSPPPGSLPQLFFSWLKPFMWFLQLPELIMTLVTHYCHCS